MRSVMHLELMSDDEEKMITENQHSEGDESQYSGLERRMEQRRKKVDRREMVRFEEKAPRRKGSDLRSEVKL
ncbi:hypothetical protein [Psychromonas sp. MB-3u-54]|uniref:hypothetical protein n=1 Tax=Psychromonas sp. MB-3u-54 TaxID=2058319 RepID=UPI0012FEAA45|nr:hypothetical protein [Psychromonas sp. MB-3u-54]